jgi:branched-chain amino acid transport system substrate-binding protein
MWKRKRLLLLLAALMLVLSACGGGSSSSSPSPSAAPSSSADSGASSAPGNAPETPAANKEPLKIGVIFSFTGSLAPLSDSMKEGIDLYLAENNNVIHGHPVQVIYEDDEGDPQVGLRKYRSLVDNQKVDLLIGTTNSAVLGALMGEIVKDQIPLIISNAASVGVSWDNKNDYAWRTSFSNFQNGSAGGKYWAENLGKTAIYIGPDFPAGHEVDAAFRYAFEGAGGKVVKSLFPKLGTNDFATYITEIASTKPDFVFAFLPGTDGVRFHQQYQQFNLQGQIPIAGALEHGDSLITDPAGSSAEGTLANVPWFPALDNPVNKQFMESFQQKYNKIPNIFTVNGYDSMKLIHQLIEKADSKKADDLINVLKSGVTMDSPRGQINIDPATHNPTQNFYIVKNVMKDGRIVQEVLTTIGNVTMPEKDPTK